MAQMISQLDPLTDDLADDDLLVVVDSSDLTESVNGTTKRMDAQQIIAKNLKTTTGPTVLAIGAVADGQVLQRSGGTIIGAAVGGGVPASSTNIIPYSDGSAFQNSPLSRADANTIEQSNGTSVTSIRQNLYGLKNGANYERLASGYDGGSNWYVIATEKGGTGSARSVAFIVNGSVLLHLNPTTKLISAWDSDVRFSSNGGAANSPGYQLGGGSGTSFKGMYSPDTGDIGFSTSSTYRLRIADAGVMVGANDGFLFSSTALGSGVTPSVGIHRQATGVAEINDGTKGNSGVLLLRGRTFANLPASPVAGMMATVTDSNTTTWGATIAGGGANNVLARYNGSNWTVVGI